MEIAGSNVIVTGGASGIGRGLCERFATLGAANVVVADLDLASAETVADAIGGTARHCDVSDDQSVRSLVADSIADMAQVRRGLNDLKVPMRGRQQIVSSEYEQSLLSVDSFVEADKAGT